MSERPYHHGDLRNQLLAASIDLLAAGGVDALTLREAARRAGVSHGAPYRHFADREALLDAIAAEGFTRMAAVMRQAVDRAGDDPAAQLLALGRAYVRFALDNPAQLQVLFRGTKAERDAVPAVAAAGLAAFEVPLGVVRSGQERGLVVAGDAEQQAQVAWALVHGIATLVTGGQTTVDPDDPESLDRLIGDAIAALWAGLRAR